MNLQEHHSSVIQERGWEYPSKLWNHIFKKKIPSSQKKSESEDIRNQQLVSYLKFWAESLHLGILSFRFSILIPKVHSTKPGQKGWHYKSSHEQALPLFCNQTSFTFSEIPNLSTCEMLPWVHHAHSSITFHYPKMYILSASVSQLKQWDSGKLSNLSKDPQQGIEPATPYMFLEWMNG